MIGNGKRPLSLKDRVDDYTLGLEDKKEKRKEKRKRRTRKPLEKYKHGKRRKIKK